MVVFPCAKINLGLNILRKRPDGYHDLETLFYPIGWCDVLEILPLVNQEDALKDLPKSKLLLNSLKEGTANTYEADDVHFTLTGNNIEGNPSDNLVIKAFRKFYNKVEQRTKMLIHLHKIIPSGAGLGGGSSDASYVLNALNKLEGNPLTTNEIRSISAELGCDCPFFVHPVPSLASGRGELLSKFPLSVEGHKIIVVKPPVHVPTADAYSKVIPHDVSGKLMEILNQHIELWQGKLNNDFEESVFAQYPEVEKIKMKLLESGAVYASMSGSGSAVFGIFKGSIPDSINFQDCIVWKSEW